MTGSKRREFSSHLFLLRATSYRCAPSYGRAKRLLSSDGVDLLSCVCVLIYPRCWGPICPDGPSPKAAKTFESDSRIRLLFALRSALQRYLRFFDASVQLTMALMLTSWHTCVSKRISDTCFFSCCRRHEFVVNVLSGTSR